MNQVCGFIGHSRSSSSGCPFFKRTPKQQQQAVARARAPPDSKKKLSVVKMGLRSWVKDKRLLAAIQSFQKRSTRIVLEASLFMNAFYLWCIENDHNLPDFSNTMVARTFLNRVFSFVSVLPEEEGGRSKKTVTPDLRLAKKFYDEWFCDRIPSHHRPASRRNLWQALNMLADGYRVAMMNLVTTTLHGRVKRLAKWFLLRGFQDTFESAHHPVKREISDMIAGHWIHQLTELGPDATFSLPPKAATKVGNTPGAMEVCRAAWLRLVAFLRTFSLKEDVVEAEWYRYFPLLARINAEFREHRTAFNAVVATWQQLAPRTRKERYRMDARSGKLLKPFALLPHHSVQPKFVTFDIDVLKHLRREAFWLEYGKMPPREQLDDEAIWESSVRRKLVVTEHRKFDYRFSTDGVSVSIQCFTMVPPDSGPPPQFPTVEELAKYEKILTFDEGRIDLLGGVGSDIPEFSNSEEDMPGADDEFKIHLSNKEYQTRTGNKWRTRQANRWKRTSEIDTIERVTPSKKVSTLAEYETFLVYGYRHLHKLQTFYGSVKQRRLRFDAYISKQKVQHEVCEKLIKQAGGDATKIVAIFGAAKFSGSSPGHAPSGRCGWLRKGFRKRGALVPPDLDEYRTSQHCSRCPGVVRGVKIHWQVKTCKRCYTTWNRDTNAGRSFRYIWLHCVRHQGERPAHFRRPVRFGLDNPVPPPPDFNPMELDLQ